MIDAFKGSEDSTLFVFVAVIITSSNLFSIESNAILFGLVAFEKMKTKAIKK